MVKTIWHGGRIQVFKHVQFDLLGVSVNRIVATGLTVGWKKLWHFARWYWLLPISSILWFSDATIYVGGLDEKVSDPILWELFLQAGPVSKYNK